VERLEKGVGVLWPSPSQPDLPNHQGIPSEGMRDLGSGLPGNSVNAQGSVVSLRRIVLWENSPHSSLGE
jgi:hypothetical protein